jgi:hypothetical protein
MASRSFEQMPAIDGLLGLWGSLSGSFLVWLGAIPADEFHRGMLPEPFSKGFCTAIFEQSDRLMRRSI